MIKIGTAQISIMWETKLIAHDNVPVTQKNVNMNMNDNYAVCLCVCISFHNLFIYLLKLHAQTLYKGGINALGIFYQLTLG